LNFFHQSRNIFFWLRLPPNKLSPAVPIGAAREIFTFAQENNFLSEKSSQNSKNYQTFGEIFGHNAILNSSYLSRVPRD
jgi:hypothetical protein